MSQHTKEFIAEMKDKLEAEKNQLKNELKKISHEADGEYKANFPEYGRDEEDNATEIGDYVATAATGKTIEDRLHNVEGALERIANNTYGITDDGKLIPEERLRANPAATTIVEK